MLARARSNLASLLGLVLSLAMNMKNDLVTSLDFYLFWYPILPIRTTRVRFEKLFVLIPVKTELQQCEQNKTHFSQDWKIKAWG